MAKPRRNTNFEVYNVRLLSNLDKLLRDKPRYLGELSTSINDALLAVNLDTVELVKLQSRQKQTGRETQVVILRRLRNRIHQVAQKRKCSMNQLVNSALLTYYSKTGRVKLQTINETARRSLSIPTTPCRRWNVGSFTRCSRIYSATQSVSTLAEEPDGTHYEYDRNLKTTVRVTPDGERHPVKKFDSIFEHAPL